MTRTVVLAMALLAGSAGAAMAQEAPPKSVEIKGLKDPEMRSYRHVSAGLDVFDEFHAQAPAVPALRFRIKFRKATEDKSVDSMKLNIVGESAPIPVPIEPDGTFTIARSDTAYDENADLMFNRKRQQFQSFADIRTPGLPANVRRLGDLRLECKVNMAIIKKEVPFYIRGAINTFLLTTDWCSKLTIYLSMPEPKELNKVTLSYQDRKRELSSKELEEIMETPLLDQVAWPDDTLLEMELAPKPEGVGGA
jgi:hypothetical protein